MRKNQILQYASLAFAALALLLQSLAVLLQYDTDANYFQKGAILPTLAFISAIIAAIAGTAFACTMERRSGSAEIFSGEIPYASIFTAAGFALSAFLFVISLADGELAGIAMLTFLAAIGATLYAVATLSPALRAYVNATAALGFLAPITCILFNAYYYFDTSIEMNSPIKTATQVGLLCAMLYFLSELRFLMGQPLPRLFVATAHLTSAFGALSAVAVPVAYLTGKCDRLDYVAGAALTLCILIASVIRTRTFLQSAGE